MANDRNDFEPAIRNSAWWSGDTRKAVDGKANEAIMLKLGMIEPPDLSDVEAVQMGHVMQPIIGRLAQDALKIELKDADYSLSHSRESWLKSHFDFISADGRTLVEAKNYSAFARKGFDEAANIVPAADYAQCLHEATVHGVDRVVLAVLFGGQEFRTFDFTFSAEQKDELIQQMATYWGAVQAKAPLPAESPEQARAMYTRDNGQAITANAEVERACLHLRKIKDEIKKLEDAEKHYTTQLQNLLKDASTLVSVEGNVLCTWKAAKGSMKFDAKLFEQSMPDIYKQFMREVPGSRRFLVK